MNAIATETKPENIVPLTIQPRPKPAQRPQRFKITEFRNRAGSISFRVAGYKSDGARVRENFTDENTARCRQIALEAEYLQQPSDTAVRATKLSDDQLRLAELAINRLGEDWGRIVDAVDLWIRSGGKSLPAESPRIDDAVDQYQVWLDASSFRDATKRHWRIRLNLFRNSVQNVRVSEVTPEFIEKFLAGRNVSPSGKDTDRRAVSRFFSWCIERPRRWATSNPCREVKVDLGEKSAPAVLSLADCKAILRLAESHKGGILAPFTAVCLFGGLRPFEAARLTWEQVNLKDGEIRLDSTQTKTKTGRTVKICPTLKAWLKAYKDKPFYPANWRKEFDAIKSAAGFGITSNEKTAAKPWPSDVLRHTAISHYFRATGSYGFAAEQFGNSEAIIKAHYQSRVSSDEAKAFYRLMPAKGGAK
jgi:integrase